jgi:heat shock protein HslJ
MTGRGTMLATLAVAAALGLAACGGDDTEVAGGGPGSGATGSSQAVETATVESLDGLSFTATDARGADITPKSTLTVSFDGERVAVDAGCNSISGNYSIEDDGEIQSFMITTMMGCPPAIQDLEVFATELFRQGAIATRTGEGLELEGLNGNSLTVAED